ncbi:hypothetical protein L6452_32051 [Arctium lappa]|uniref:Uncharacterized protein n=1 Tax=Arctium lappa TaxID=4217 RepID=A0ACB8Z4F2_ARCLA|nr:hypothetical protein L6452_32051 [Arctium lappa]
MSLDILTSIQLEEIKLATNNFADNKFIGQGGFGKVYKGEVSHSKGRSMVAFTKEKYLTLRFLGNGHFVAELVNIGFQQTKLRIHYFTQHCTREERPTMARVVEELEIALAKQEIYEGVKQPKDYEAVIETAVPPLIYRSKEELETLLSEGILVDRGKTLFSLAKNGKICPMLAPRAFLVESDWTWETQHNSRSRFEEVAVVDPYVRSFSIACKIRSQILSPQTTYACYLIYMITDNFLEFEAPLEVTDQDFCINDCHLAEFWFIYLISHPTPVVMPKLDQNTLNQSNRSKRKDLQTPFIIPKLDQNSENRSNRPEMQGRQRHQGYPLMEVQVWEFRTGDTTEMISMNFSLKSYAPTHFEGLVVQGIEFKPISWSSSPTLSLPSPFYFCIEIVWNT